MKRNLEAPRIAVPAIPLSQSLPNDDYTFALQHSAKDKMRPLNLVPERYTERFYYI